MINFWFGEGRALSYPEDALLLCQRKGARSVRVDVWLNTNMKKGLRRMSEDIRA